MKIKSFLFICLSIFILGCEKDSSSPQVLEKKNTTNYSPVSVYGNQIGLKVSNGDTIQNYSKINVFDSGVGMLSEIGSTITNKSEGMIHVDGVEATGMQSQGSNSLAENYGIIYINSSGAGMKSKDGGVAINFASGFIYVNGEYGKGMVASNNSTTKNYGQIYTKTKSIGMYAEGSQSSVVNEANGNIYVGGSNGIGMLASGKGSSAQNYGKIIFTQESTNSIGLKGLNGAIIKLGNIQDLGVGDRGNKIFYIENAIAVNNSFIRLNEEFNISKFGTGKFVINATGMLMAPKVSGDIYLDSYIVKPFENEGRNNSAIISIENEVGWFTANVKSWSEYFEASYESSSSGMMVDLILKRKNFNTVFADKELAQYLENNYTNTNSSNKEKFYESILRETELTTFQVEEKMKKIFGVEFYPSYKSLINNLIGYNSKTIFDNYLKIDYEKEGVNPVIGIERNDFDYKGVNKTLQGYNGYEHVLFLGLDLFGTENFRYGTLAILNQGKTNFENESELKNNYMFQGNIYLAYKLESMIDFFISPYIGGYEGDIERKVIESTVNSKGSGKYFGSLARINRNFDFRDFYILPEVQFDYGQNFQKEIEEEGNISLKYKFNKTTKANLLGFVKFGKIFDVDGDLKFDASLKFDYSQEFGNPIGEINVQVSGAEEGSYTIKNYDKIGSEANGIVRASFFNDFLELYGEYSYAFVGERTTGYTITYGGKYKFNY